MITKDDVHLYKPSGSLDRDPSAYPSYRDYGFEINPRDVSPRIGRIDCSKERCLTQQSAKDECDINLIVESAKRGADISHLSSKTPVYGDFTNVPSYRESLLIINDARDRFNSLDAHVRERFGNDPARLLDFLSDENNREEAVKLGLVNAPPAPKPVDEHLETLKSIDVSLKGKKGLGGHGKGPKGDGDDN